MKRLKFENTLLDGDLRALIGARIGESDILELLNGELTFLPSDHDLGGYSQLDAISLEVFGALPYEQTRTDLELQNHSTFSVEIEIYTQGKKKKQNNRIIQDIIIDLLQEPKKLQNFYNSGLLLVETSEGNALIDNTYRSVLRFGGLCDNQVKYIYPKI